jgi:hypothetical protein
VDGCRVLAKRHQIKLFQCWIVNLVLIYNNYE